MPIQSDSLSFDNSNFEMIFLLWKIFPILFLMKKWKTLLKNIKLINCLMNIKYY